MKKTLAALMLAALTTLAVACGHDEEPAAPTPAAEQTPAAPADATVAPVPPSDTTGTATMTDTTATTAAPSSDTAAQPNTATK